MKFPKIVLKKTAQRRGKEAQLGVLERHPSRSNSTSAVNSSSAVSSPHAVDHQRQQQQQQQQAGPSPRTVKATLANVLFASPSTQRGRGPQAAAAPSPRAAPSRSRATDLGSLVSSSAASSLYGDDDGEDSRSGDDGRSSRSSASTASRATSRSSGDSTSRSTLSRSVSCSTVAASPTATRAGAGAVAEPGKNSSSIPNNKLPRTQYSAYARKMKTASRRRRRQPPRSNSAVDFDDADEFFDKSDSSLGVGNSPSVTPGSDVARGARHSGSDDSDTLSDEDDEEVDAVEVQMRRGSVQQPYRSSVAMGRRMTQNEVNQRQIAREREEALLAARFSKMQRGFPSSNGVGSPHRPIIGVLNAAAFLPPQQLLPTSPGAPRSSNNSSNNTNQRSSGAPALSATSTTAPAEHGEAETRTGGGSADKPTGLQGWRRKFLGGSQKGSRNTSQNDIASPSARSFTSTASGSYGINSNKVLSASSPVAANKSARMRGGSGETRQSGSPLFAASGSPRARTGAGAAAGLPAFQSATTPHRNNASAPAASTTRSGPLKTSKPISKETLRSLDDRQLSRLDFAAQKARKTARHDRHAGGDFGPLGFGTSPSFVSSGGYGSFMDVLAAETFSDEDADDRRSSGSRHSRSSRRSSASAGSRRSSRSSASGRSGGSSRRHSLPTSHRQERQQQPGASTAREKPLTRSGSFFRALFRGSSGASKKSSRRSSPSPPLEKRHSGASAAAAERQQRGQPSTATQESTPAAEKASTHTKERPRLSRQALQRASESPGSDASGMGTSLYHMGSTCSTTTTTATATTGSSHHSMSSSTSTSSSIGTHAALANQHHGQLLRRNRGNLRGSLRQGSRTDMNGTAADLLMRPQTALGADDSFGSLFAADIGDYTASSAALSGAAAPTTASAALYGTPRLTPSEFGSAPTPGGSTVSNQVGVARAAASQKGLVGEDVTPSLSSSLQPTPSANEALLFPHNSYPRTAAAAAAAAVTTGSGMARPAAAGSGDVHAAPVVASANTFNTLWHPHHMYQHQHQQQQLRQHLLSQLEPSARMSGVAAGTAAAGPGSQAAANMTPGGSATVAAMKTTATSVPLQPGTSSVGNTTAATADAMQGSAATAVSGGVSAGAAVVSSSAVATKNVSPTPLIDEFAGQTGGSNSARSPPQTSLHGDDVSLRGGDEDATLRRERSTRRRQQQQQRRNHRDDEHGADDDEASTGGTSRHGKVTRKYSLLSVSEGFRVRGKGKTASGSSSSSSSRPHHRSGADGESRKSKTKQTSGSSSRGNNGDNATAAHPPLGPPPSGDPRRSDNGRHSSGGVGSGRSAAILSDDATTEQSQHRSSATTHARVAPTNSGSLLPQPPTLSNTESKNYRGRGATTTAAGAGSNGNSINAANAVLTAGSDGHLPTRADSKDFLLRNDADEHAAATHTNTTAAAASPRRPSRESSKRNRPRKTSSASTRYDGSFSFSSESLLDGKARGRLAKAAAASNAATSSAERRRGHSAHGSIGNAGPEGEGSASKRRLHTRDQTSTSARALQHFKDEDGEEHEQQQQQHQHHHHRHHHHRHRGSGTVRRSGEGGDIMESSGSQRRRRSRNDLYGSSRRPSSASVSLVAGLDEVLPHRPMQTRNASSSSAFSSSAAPSSRNSSVSSGERHGDSVNRNSVRCLRKMAAKARDGSASSSCDLEARAANSRSDTGIYANTKAMQPVSEQHSGSNNGTQQMARVQQSNSSATSATAPRIALGNGSGTVITSTTNGGVGAAYAMKLPSFKPSMIGESSSSNDVSTDRHTNSGGSRQQQQYQHQAHSGNGGDAAAQHLQRMPLTMSHDGGGTASGPRKGSGTYLLLPTRPAGSNGIGRALHTANNNGSGTNEGGLGGGDRDGGSDRVMTSADQHRQATIGTGGGPPHPVVQPPPSSVTGSGGVGGVENKSDGGGGGAPFLGENGLPTSVPTALLAQPRDVNAKRRRPATENFTPWSVDMSRFDRLRQAQVSSPPSS